MNKNLFTSESVLEGHPDKVCDQISDAVLDAVLSKDINGRVACETMVTRGTVIVAGEITTNAYVDIPDIARDVIRHVGYTSDDGFNYNSVGVLAAIQKQSPDISMGVDKGGAGDQGIMFGYATNETPELMPFPIDAAHTLAKYITSLRKDNIILGLKPDGKVQVTVNNKYGKYIITDIVVSVQHIDSFGVCETLRNNIIWHIKPYLENYYKLDLSKTNFYINPTGSFVVGGPEGDTGLTGRKIIDDTYGGTALHGGGAFSGKDPTKVDRSASYMARYLAKNIVASGICTSCQIQLAYIIGKQQPVSLMVTMNDAKTSLDNVLDAIKKEFDLSPQGIIKHLKLLRPIYRKTACYGHFGREDKDFTWEKLDAVSIFKDLC